MSKLSSQFDVAIIGAGVLGTSLAYHLSLRGARVCVLEREPFVAAHASGKNAGMIRQLYRNPQLSEWAQRSIATWPKELRTFFQPTGSLIVGRTLPTHHQQLFATREIDSPDGRLPAVYCASDGLLDSPGYVEGLRKLASVKGASFRFHTLVQELQPSAAYWEITINHLQQNNTQTIIADWVVNAAGAWLNTPLPHDNAIMPLSDARVAARPYARHLFVVEGWGTEQLCQEHNCGFYWDEHHGWYMRAWDTNTRLVSICDQQVVAAVEHYSPNIGVYETLAEKVLTALPQKAANLCIRQSWHCFRTYCDDQMPIFGQDQRFPGLFWLAAFGGYGMSTSFAATADAAKILLDQDKESCPEFSPSRVQNASPQLRAIAQ